MPLVAASRPRIAAALATVYLVWGSTYLGMRIAVRSLGPLLLTGARYLVAGALLWALARARGEAPPTRAQWRGAGIVGVLLLVVGNGGVAVAVQWVSSSAAALLVASVPLWAALFTSAAERRAPSLREVAALLVGMAGVAALSSGGELRAKPLGAIVLLIGSASWALGSVWSRTLPLAEGMMGTAAQMLVAGLVMIVAALVARDWPSGPVTVAGLVATAYLVVFGSVVAYSAYVFLLRTVRPAIATSYAYVNPVVAVILGVGLGGETLGPSAIAGMVLVLTGVGLLFLPGATRAPSAG